MYKRIVIKIGTKVIASPDRNLDKDIVKDLASQAAAVINNGSEVIMVTSGAIGAGLSLLNIKKRPRDISDLQATAAIGQNYLMRLYGEFFKKAGYLTGQILLTQEDFDDRTRFLNIRHTIDRLLRHKAVPIINENDTVATEEIRCGDNDRLSSLVADLSGADKLIILTDVDGLLDEDGSVIGYVDDITPRIAKLAVKSRCDLGTGGMSTKLEAARLAMRAGIECVIANGKERNVLTRMLIKGDRLGTIFKSGARRFIAKKRWIAYSSKPKGALFIDKGAKDAIFKNKSLLASGIVSVEGDFVACDVIKIIDDEKKEIARGIANYSSRELAEIKGLKTAKFKEALGREGPDEVVHKNNLVILENHSCPN
ncbi:MAG: glutamate 5-kinase [Omnitrophica bacterium RIFCSPLOWO2_01_FULL_45_10]|nr:MAG: glutamate 5-kinase [Omnitrophica bacterium RIFCSPLOWO2_01_FULL_45_10]